MPATESHPTILTDVEMGENGAGPPGRGRNLSTALPLGGTLSGEHGDRGGQDEYLGDELNGSGLNLMRRLKDALDPIAS
jgi:glycolate oxidase